MKDKIRFKNLSVPNKIAISLAWFVGILYLYTFFVGFTVGVLS